MSAAAVEDVVRGFKKAIIERALGAELSHHRGHGQALSLPLSRTIAVTSTDIFDGLQLCSAIENLERTDALSVHLQNLDRTARTLHH